MVDAENDLSPYAGQPVWLSAPGFGTVRVTVIGLTDGSAQLRAPLGLRERTSVTLSVELSDGQMKSRPAVVSSIKANIVDVEFRGTVPLP